MASPLLASIVLACSAVLSAGKFLLNHKREGTIRLPLNRVPNRADNADHLQPEEDPFDVIETADMVDGVPVEEDRFWAKIRTMKFILAAVLVFTAAAESVALGFTMSTDLHASTLVAAVLRLAFATYLLIVCVAYVRDDVVATHWAITIHLSALTTAAAVLLALSAGLPTASPRKKSEAGQMTSILAPLNFTTIGLYCIASIISSTTPRGPLLYFPPERIYSKKTLESSTPLRKGNVSGVTQSSVLGVLMFDYVTPVILLGYRSEYVEVRDLPIIPANMRGLALYAKMRLAMKTIDLGGRLSVQSGSGWALLWKLLKVNALAFFIQITLGSWAAALYYVPALFLQRLISYLENDPGRQDMSWGWVYCAGLFIFNALTYIINGQLWGMSTTTLKSRLRIQLNTILFAKTLVRKDVASTVSSSPSTEPSPTAETNGKTTEPEGKADQEASEAFSSKASIMTLMTTDVDRVSEFSTHLFSLISCPIEILAGSVMLYYLLGVSSLFGIAAGIVFLPLTHFASKIVVHAQDNLMKTRDERVALMNELLGAIRMVKFMAWERNSEERVLRIRRRELHYQNLSYRITTFLGAIWLAPPILMILVAFFHFSVIRGRLLTPSIAFTAVSVFNDLRFALSDFPGALISIMQSFVSARRIEKYLCTAEISRPSVSLELVIGPITVNSATITWPGSRSTHSLAPSGSSTPKGKFSLMDITLAFPAGELSLVCGKLGSGKTLLLLALLGEVDLLAGQVICPRTPADSLATSSELDHIPDKEWIVPGFVAYVPQSAWLQNASVRDNILFSLPYNEARYTKTLEVCALVADLEILEDGDLSEIGERGVTLSGGQKARISLARAVYSRASILLLDDVLSAVDAHTAHHLYEQCLNGDLLRGRTIILVSHHVQLCLPRARYVIALDNGSLLYRGDPDGFRASGIIQGIDKASELNVKEEASDSTEIEDLAAVVLDPDLETKASSISTATPISQQASKSDGMIQKVPRKVVEDESRTVGRIERKVWMSYFRACGGYGYWLLFVIVLLLGAAVPAAENGWLRYWSASGETASETSPGALFYIGIYTTISIGGLIVQSFRLYVLYEGSIHASTVLYKRLLEAVLLAKIRVHDRISRGRLLNRFGKDFEEVDSSLADRFGKVIVAFVSALTSVTVVTAIGGPGFVVVVIILGYCYYNVAKIYSKTCRDLQRLDSVTKSPLYTIYGDTISGVGVLRAFGAPTMFLREMVQQVDTNTNPYYWMWSAIWWLSVRMNTLSSVIIGMTGLVCLLNSDVDAPAAGFALAFASTVMHSMMAVVGHSAALEQGMVALERINEFSEIEKEAAEIVEPRPPFSWPQDGRIEVENLKIRYAPDLPNVLHGLTFSVKPQSKIGILGRTGCGKSTLALSFFRFVEPSEGRIIIDGVDIAKIGLADLRSRITIIPQDPAIFSGTLRSTLDVFEEYADHDIFEALRRVHLLPSDVPVEQPSSINENVFRNLDSPVAEGGENFSAGEKQLICMARAILRRSKILFMDEATASVDYVTDELISKTIREEFSQSTILTIAHRLRTVIDYDKVMVLDNGRIAEFDSPGALLADPTSMFYALCRSTGPTEFAMLQRIAEEAGTSGRQT